MRRVAFVYLCGTLILLSGNAMAQTGKISGYVRDAAAGIGLPGVNVVIDGTTQGTATGIDGSYVIIGVRPGTYNVVASFIGYAVETKQGVRVNVDLTTTVDFSLREEVFQGEEVVVTAEAITVRKDLTSSEARVTAETIENLPATELDQVLEIQAGITNRNGLHIRGGRSSEVMYMVDGVPVTDSYDGSRAIEVENDGIEELQVISGTFNAEYGNAMSGVINIVTKEGGGDKIEGSVELYTGTYAVGGSGGEEYLRGTDVDELADPVSGVQYRGVDPYSYLDFDPSHFRQAKVSLEGPILGDRLTFFGLGRFFENDGWLWGTRLFNIDGSPGDSALVPMNTFQKFSWQGNLKYRISRAFTLNVGGLGTTERNRDYSLFRRWSPDGRTKRSDDGYDLKLKLTHLLSPTTFYAVNLATFYRQERFRRFEDAFDERYNDFDFNPPDTVLTGGGRFARGGTDLGRADRSTRSYMVKFDLSSQIGKNHLVKTGFLARVDQLDFNAFLLVPATDPVSGATLEPFVPDIPNEKSPTIITYENLEPVSFSAYLQDKMEFENFIVNAGIRLDYFDSGSRIPADPTDPNIFSPFKKINRFNDTNGDGVISIDEEAPGNELTREDREAYWWKDAKPKVQFSPRLGVAYPITEAGVVHFSFGLFFQQPTLNRLFEQFGYKIPSLSGSYGVYGNPNLDAQKTTMYEIGFKQGLGDFVVDVTGYYRDVRSWVATSPPIPTALPGISYFIYANRDYANTRGVTLTLKKNYRQHWGADFSYTYQVVEGSNSNPQDLFFALTSNREPALALLPLEWDQRHKVAGVLYGDYSGFGASFRMRTETGFPYTPSFPSAAVVGNDVQPEFAQNSRRQPPAFEVDLTLEKQFMFGRFEPRLFVEIFNLFDARNVTGVFSDTGEPDLTLEQFRQGSVDPGFWIRPEFYREPRRIQVGIDFKF